jgi:hypothetical protein
MEMANQQQNQPESGRNRGGSQDRANQSGRQVGGQNPGDSMSERDRSQFQGDDERFEHDSEDSDENSGMSGGQRRDRNP